VLKRAAAQQHENTAWSKEAHEACQQARGNGFRSFP